MRKFQANTHNNPEFITFVGDSWEDGGFRVDDDGAPTHDNRGNTVALFYETDLGEEDEELIAEMGRFAV